MPGFDPDSERPTEVPKVRLKDFPGLVTNVDPREIPAGGSVHQVNVVANVFGELRVRQGTAVLSFAK